MHIDAYLRCFNYYCFKYIIGLSEPRYAEALVFGIIMHTALETWYITKNLDKAEQTLIAEAAKWAHESNLANPKGPRSISNGLAKLRMYADIYKNDSFKHISSEVEHLVLITAKHVINQVIASNIKQVSITREIPIYYLTHIDTVGRYYNNLAFLEHKTTSLYSTSPVLNTYTYSLQVIGYIMSLMDKYKLVEPCKGYIDLIFLRAKTRENMTLRYPVLCTIKEITTFKDFLSTIIGDILWREKSLKEFTLPTPSRCAIYNRVCEYSDVCKMLPDVIKCEKFLKSKGFVDTMPARLDHILEEGKEVVEGKKYYKLIKGLTLC